MNNIASAAARCGVETGYHDARGEWCAPREQALAKVIDVLATYEPYQPPRVQRDSRTPTDDPMVLVAPRRAYQPEALRDRGVWMLAVQLYGVRSQRNWGIGDFSDLAVLLGLAAEIGAAGIALNPLHALLDGQVSPYSPSSRLFLNALAIDVERVPGFPGRAALGLGAEIERLRASEQVDYAGVAKVKMAALRAAFDAFRADPQRAGHDDFEAFRARHADTLVRFATFETLWRQFRAPWWDWPRPFRRPTPFLFETVRRNAGTEIEFHEFIQWQADAQLSACRELAHYLRLPIGLYLDIAVGVTPDGADCWGAQDSLMRGLSVGAPPDVYNPAGQNWGLASFHPAALVGSDFALLRQTLHASMRYAGAVRLDHVIGLNRLFVIPEGSGAGDGTSVRFPLEAMMAVVAQESVATRCLVIGEDLGTVPAGFRDVAADWGVWTYRVTLFERAADGQFLHPHVYPAGALVSFNTHDLPTFAGWLSGHDLMIKRAVGVDPGENEAERDATRRALASVLAACDLGHDITLPALTRFMARTPSRLLVISAEDVLGVIDQPNMPGTVDEYPNWRRKLPVDLRALAASPSLRELAAVLTEEHRASGRT